MTEPQPTRGYRLSPKEKAYDIVMGLPAIAIEGNVLPPQWLKHLRFPNGKPHAIAAILLSDVVYWYRPIILRDEVTGEVLPPRKKFKADLIQRSYDTYVELYGFTKRQVKDAFHYLESEGLVTLDFRTIDSPGGKLGNVLFIGLNIFRLAEITTPPMTLERNRVSAEALEVSRQNGTGITPERHTNTDSTTQTTTDKKSLPPSGKPAKDYLTDVVTLQGKTSEVTAPAPVDQWLNYRDEALAIFQRLSGAWGHTPQEREVRKGLITGGVAERPDFDPARFEQAITESLAAGVNSANIARFWEVYDAGGTYKAYLAQTYGKGNGAQKVSTSVGRNGRGLNQSQLEAYKKQRELDKQQAGV
jgi:hypothetical protein